MLVDTVMYFGERDVLDIRLHELYDVVDRFLVVEGDRTFQGAKREPQFLADFKYLTKQDPDLKSLSSKIRYHVVSDWPELYTEALGPAKTLYDSKGLPFPSNQTVDGLNAELREIHLRNSVTRYMDAYAPETTVILADVDEIPRAETLPTHEFEPSEFHRLGGPMYQYFLNLRLAEPYQWYGARLCRLDLLRRTTSEWLRQNRGEGGVGGQPGDIPNGAWHFSFLNSGVDGIIRKIEAWRHPEFAMPPYTDRAHLARCLRDGFDWWTERNLDLRWCDVDETYPWYVRARAFREMQGMLGGPLRV